MCLEVPMQSVRMQAQAHTHLTFHGDWCSVLPTSSMDSDVAYLKTMFSERCFSLRVLTHLNLHLKDPLP